MYLPIFTNNVWSYLLNKGPPAWGRMQIMPYVEMPCNILFMLAFREYETYVRDGCIRGTSWLRSDNRACFSRVHLVCIVPGRRPSNDYLYLVPFFFLSFHCFIEGVVCSTAPVCWRVVLLKYQGSIKTSTSTPPKRNLPRCHKITA